MVEREQISLLLVEMSSEFGFQPKSSDSQQGYSSSVRHVW